MRARLRTMREPALSFGDQALSSACNFLTTILLARALGLEAFGLYTMVKPGITGLWQVSGRNNTTYDERVQLDAYYVRNWSPWVDAFLLLKTIRIVLFARGAY